VASEAAQTRSRDDRVRNLVPVFAVAVAVVAAVKDPSSVSDLVLMAVPVVAFGLWTFRRGTPLALVAVGGLVPTVLVQRSGGHEPLMFEASLLAIVVGRWSESLPSAVALGLLAVAAPVVVGAIETHGNLSVGIWVIGIAFPWAVGRTALHQARLTAQLEATRADLAEQAMLEERRRIARDVHDFQ
jgi:signal transduction histidine kinase